MPKFIIEQIALYPRNPQKALELLSEMGLDEWAHDHVAARGRVFSQPDVENQADLNFNYQGFEGGRAHELEVLHYTHGLNWMTWGRPEPRPRVSHLGMHCTEEELKEWRLFFAERQIPLAQEVRTFAHTNPVIAGKRKYHYVIFNTYAILGVDIKFIIRHDPSDF
jgi:hypothetical protein